MTLPRHIDRAAADRRRGWRAVIGGAALVLAIQVAAPVGVPLYDGVVVEEPYRYLQPTGDHPGDPTSGTDTEQVSGNVSPILVVSTLENPPQAQLIAQDGAFDMPAGTTMLLAAVDPIEPPAPPTGMTLVGNAYRFSVTDQRGDPVALTTCQDCRSLILRAPDPTITATVKQFANGAWVDLPTTPANLVGFQVEPTTLGDFALFVAAGSEPVDGGDGGGISPILLVGVGGAVLLVLAGAFLFFRVRQAPAPTAPSTSIPSKRKPPRRPPPPPGRSRR